MPTVEAGLRAAGVPHRLNVYPGAGHAFFRDTGGAYNETAALAAWRDTLDWFGTYLRVAGASALPATGDGGVGPGGDGQQAIAE
jgi:acetyl esterase/lipase